MTTCVDVVAPAALWMRGGGFGCHAYNDADIHAAVRSRAPAAADLPMPGAAFFAALYRRGLRSVRVPAAGSLASEPTDADAASPKTPTAVLRAPISYGDDGAAAEGAAVVLKTSPPVAKKQPSQELAYDSSIDATFRDMERRHEERPSADYLSDTQEGGMMMTDRAELIAKMHHFFRYYDLAPSALHRAVSYVDRFLSAKKFSYGDRESRLLGAAAVFAAAKYEDQSTVWKIDADSVEGYAGCTRREAVDAERELLTALGYRVSGPTAYTFVDHFMRNIQEDDDVVLVKSLAHHLADMALLDYRCVAFLPSAVGASAIYLATLLALGYSTAPVAGYKLDDLSDCMEAIYDMHENRSVWPGCDQMMTDWEITTQLPYSLPPPPYTLVRMQ